MRGPKAGTNVIGGAAGDVGLALGLLSLGYLAAWQSRRSRRRIHLRHGRKLLPPVKLNWRGSERRCGPMSNPTLRSTVTAAVILLGFAGAAPAQVTFELINEYPATSISGEADTFFAEAVRHRTEGRVTIKLVLNATSGLRSRDQVKAVTEGHFAIADSFGGALGDESPMFLLSSLPFLTPSIAHTRALYEAARPIYERRFAERRQKLLYVTPWPPSGIWSKLPITDASVLKSLKIRTYDKTSTDVFSRLASSATIASFSDLNTKLQSGEINAVLSSGDGGAGRGLWKYLSFFADIHYAVPQSFTAISIDAWNKLDESDRTAIEATAHVTTERAWTVLITRGDGDEDRDRDRTFRGGKAVLDSRSTQWFLMRRRAA
jgi:TRAP-type C4-dicarboxylate transport system substrate-binding protein